MNQPALAVTIGDPCGIGPEILAKAMASGEPQQKARMLFIGSADAMRRGIAVAGVDLGVKPVSSVAEVGNDPRVISILDSGVLDPAEIVIGEERAPCGAAVATWIGQAQALATRGEVAGLVMGPINSEAMAAAGALGALMNAEPGERLLTLFSGPLRITHIFDHIYLRDVCAGLTSDLVAHSIRLTEHTLRGWGVASPRIGVAGLNPHAHGPEEDAAITPGVAIARSEGIDVSGPISPDTVFRHCIDGRYDVVVAMCHDQGHIALKTWGFEGNCGGFIGMPYLFMTVGHGTAFDIAGKGIASHAMILSALNQCAQFAAGKGFLAH
ncbi:PdxA family protein [Immundisolibacter sp.]|uniref:PdxA family dehydrogenase n=1 Tax=Immundisolibacter sp. TaxID=1934948 RepID=UPI003569964C